MTCCAGLSAAEHLGAAGALVDRGDEVLDDGQRDVGLEQRDPDLAGGGVDVGVGQPALAAQVLERGGKAVGEGGEHRYGIPRGKWCRFGQG